MVKLKGKHRNPLLSGVISQVILSGQNVGLGDARIPPSVIKYDACATTNLCLNGATCRNTNNNKGFSCECNDKYHGEYCQWRSSSCHDGEVFERKLE